MPLPAALLSEGELRVARCDMLDKLIAVGDGDAALLYLYILRHGDMADEKAVCRQLHLTDERYARAVFTLTGLSAPAAPPEQSPDKPAAPDYTAQELRRARTDDHKFSAVCRMAEDALGRTLTEGQLRTLLTAYDHLGLSAEAIIELLSYLKKQKGTVRLSDIRREAYAWADMGLYTAHDVQTYLSRKADEKPLSDAIFAAVGADPAAPAPKEQRLCAFALSHGFPPDAVALAAARADRQQGKRSLDYILGILRQWEQKGVHTVSEITVLEPETRAAVGQTQAAPTDSATLAAWEQEWLERVKNHVHQTEE